jgi:formate--tetrahydrofolate ligase
MGPFSDVGKRLGLEGDVLVPWGRDVAKVMPAALLAPRRAPGPAKLVLVSAITPTPAGEGKTTTSIGLAQGLAKLGASVAVALREPSLGPVFGVKGGAVGGGASKVHPEESINLHFTGDFHAITSTNNLLAAMVDNHLQQGNPLGLDPQRIQWRRVMDMNDRSLRNAVIGLGGRADGVPRETGFDITAASEVMAALCLSEGLDDLRVRLDRILVGFDGDGKPVTPKDLKATGAMLALLKDAMAPNLVQTTEGVPAFIHGGPFANIAHGCNSVIATRTAMHHAEWTVTEAGFAFDLGGEKFFDIKCRSAVLDVVCVVLVATIRALRMHGGLGLDAGADVGGVERGLANLGKHIENVRAFGKRPIVALNRFPTDDPGEIAAVRAFCEAAGVPFAEASHFATGGAGAVALAEIVLAHGEGSEPLRPLYALDAAPLEKIKAIARTMYGARDVVLAGTAARDLGLVKRLGLEKLPICMAKTQNSLSDDPTKRGRPTGFDLTVRAVKASTGAGFLVALTGEIVRMPGLPEVPSAEGVDVVGGEIVGLR